MSVNTAADNSNGTEEETTVERAQALCAEALKICDALELSPDIGARLEEVITALEESLKEPNLR